MEDLSGFVTSAIREAPNGVDVLHAVEERTGVVLTVLSGEEEARLTFLAARRWFGWSAGTLLVADIGGGSLELAQGMDEEPDVALSLPLGAGRVTRELLRADPPSKDDLRVARKQVRATIAAELRPLAKAGDRRPRRRHVEDDALARAHLRRGPERARGCTPSGPSSGRRWPSKLPEIAGMTAKERAGLPGVSAGRAQQVLAGGVVAEAAMDLLGHRPPRDLPVGAARGRHPAAPGPDELSRAPSHACPRPAGPDRSRCRTRRSVSPPPRSTPRTARPPSSSPRAWATTASRSWSGPTR